MSSLVKKKAPSSTLRSLQIILRNHGGNKEAAEAATKPTANKDNHEMIKETNIYQNKLSRGDNGPI